jgi:HlyD family secretion protein
VERYEDTDGEGLDGLQGLLGPRPGVIIPGRHDGGAHSDGNGRDWDAFGNHDRYADGDRYADRDRYAVDEMEPDDDGPDDYLRQRPRRRPEDTDELALRTNGVIADAPPTKVAYAQPGQVEWPPPLRQPVIIDKGRGPRLGMRALVAAVIAIVVLGGIGYAVFASTRPAPLTALAAEVASTGQVDLGFPNSGVLSAVYVHPGQHVQAHQVMATEIVAGLTEQVTADQQAVTTDQTDITQLQALITSAQQELAADSASQQQTAAAGVSSAEQAIGSTAAARNQTIQAFETEVSQAQTQLNTDNSTYQSTCGGSPNGTGTNQSLCTTLANQVASDQQALTSAQASLDAQQQAQDEWTAVQNRTLQDQQAAQQGLTNNSSFELSPLEVDLQNAKSQLARDQAQLTTDKARTTEGTLIAPEAGMVASIDGAIGEVVSGAGVSGGSFSGGTVNVTPGFQLFPSQQSSAGSQGTPPVAVLQVGGPLLVNVVVPETQIGLVRVGAPVTIKPKVVGPQSLHGVVSQIFPNSIVAGGVVSYEVQVKIDNRSGRAGWLPGMTATADIGR